MDSLSHALIGIAVAGLSGQQPSLDNPVYIAAVLGAQAPDFDLITHLGGSLAYLKQHRAFSHSVPGLMIWATLITLGIHFFMPETTLFSMFIWAFAGGLSHILIDYFNTHGTAILWPFRTERKSYHLLNVFDPLLLFNMLGLYAFPLTMPELSLATFATIALYILIRIYLRHRSTLWLKNHFAYCQITRIAVMPSLKRIFFWDFVLETDNRHFVGQIGAFYPILNIKAIFPKQLKVSNIMAQAQKTPIGNFFSTFTPFIYVEEQQYLTSLQVTIYDLRYIIDNQFLHRATVIFNDAQLPTTCYMHSYGQKIEVPC
ncbi:MAG TPA: metal-dependent hydrolase [Negativicutes bacterium]|jgi:inner membrane protein